MLAVAISAVWMIRLPLLQGNDENAHADYVFALYDAGRFYRVDRRAGASNSSPALRYLENATRFESVRYLRSARVVPDYGGAGFVARLDARPPRATHALPSASTPAPFAAYAYPAGYYSLAALIMSAARAATGSFTIAYYATRSLGLVLLAASLSLAYRVLRAQGLGHGPALTLVAAIGVFPMTSWVASYVQPDNLTFALVTIALACALAWRGRPFALGRSLALGLALAALAFVKLHDALALALACAPLVASRAPLLPRVSRPRAALALAALVCIPAAAFAAARYATPAGMLRPVLDGPHGTAISQIGAGRFVAQIGNAAADAFAGGISFDRFWLAFGWNDTPFFAPPAFAIVAAFVALLSIAFAAAFAVSRVAVVRRLRAVARTRPARAIALACGDVLVNAYVVWTAMLCTVYAASDGVVSLQGRYWLPVSVATMYVSAISIRRAVPPRVRRPLSRAVARGWLAYALVAAPFALLALNDRYYGSERIDPPANVALVANARDGDATVAAPARVVADARSATLRLDGFALGGGDGSPVRAVDVLVDGAPTRATYGVAIFNANTIRPVGFVATLALRGLAPGRHGVSLRTTGAGGETTLAPGFELAISAAACGSERAPRGSAGSAQCR